MGKLRQRHGTARVLTVCGSLHCRACPLPQAISGEGWPVASATGRHLAARIGQGPTVSEVRPRAAWLSAGSAAGSRSPGPAQLSLPPLLPLWALRRGIWGCVTQQDRSSKAAVWWGLESECCGWALAVHPPPPAGKGPRLRVLQVSSEALLPCPRTGSVHSWDSRSKKLLSRATVPRRGDWVLLQEGMSGAGPEHPPAVPSSLVCTLAPGG